MSLLGEIIKHERKNAGRKEIRELIEKQCYKCALSGVPLDPDNAELDHIVPVSDGGDHSIDNLQVLHKVVNRMKGAMSNEEFVKWCGLIGHHPATPAALVGSSLN
jgi:5-methylcytosine-specific restriction endonuclease McrA